MGGAATGIVTLIGHRGLSRTPQQSFPVELGRWHFQNSDNVVSCDPESARLMRRQMLCRSSEYIAADGAFKTSGLRNIELTAPYFHNGGQRTLREVVDFYNRGGDFATQNIADLDADIRPLGLTDAEKDALVGFMKSLTDERVRYRKAPFDHPQLFIPNGHEGTTTSVVDHGFGEAWDVILELPATGRDGGIPFRNFLE